MDSNTLLGWRSRLIRILGLNGTDPGSAGTNNERIMKRITAVTPTRVENNEI
jgi:hypothetical protein